jgi:predicted DCC family thiol-disulfide oxidoreductase YuxK
MQTQYPIILFDGVCNFCNNTVNFVLKNDKKGDIKFAPLQSEAAIKLLQHYGLPSTDMKSFIFIENEIVYSKSTAALKVCKHLKGLWPLVYGFIVIPLFIRDGLYNWIAKNRYKWFGKKEICMVPTPNQKAKFLI